MKYKEAYISGLKQEMALRKSYLSDASIKTLYFGGGTPTIFSINELEKVINQLHKEYKLSEVEEFTIEANPEQMTLEYAKGLKSLGINRISIGIQSFSDRILQILGRIHTSAEAETAISNAIAAGFNNISIDLIYGIAAREPQQWNEELQRIAAFSISHFSAYSLTVEENTLLYRKIAKGELPNLDDDLSIRELHELKTFAAKENFVHYEISNFAKRGYESRHNSNYWDGVPYLGLGASAHSFDGRSRQWNCANIEEYLEAIQSGRSFYSKETLTPMEQYNEYVMLHLRTAAGIDLYEVQKKFGEEAYRHLLQDLNKLDSKYFHTSDKYIQLNINGLAIADSLTARLFRVD